VSARQLAVLDADAVRRWVSACREGLAAARDEIDDLNVYPVPDGDTGTNLLLTMESAASAVEESAPGASLGEVTAAMAKGALMGARGNSGVILSQLLRGLSDVLAEAETGSGAELKGALRRAAELAYGAVATPVEGTLLTVARECADGVEAVTSSELVDVVREAVAAAARSLAGTTELLPQLKAAGVVDAGGRGLCVLLEALQQVVTGESAASSALRSCSSRATAAAWPAPGSPAATPTPTRCSTCSPTPTRPPSSGCARCWAASATRSSSWWRRARRRAVERARARQRRRRRGRGRGRGRPALADHRHPVRRPDGRGAAGPAGHERAARRARRRRGGPGEGLATLFSDAGAVVVQGGPSANPSTGELLDALRRAGASEVVLLPNDGNTLAVASAAAAQARDEGFSVAVIPTRSSLQGLAALAVGDAERSFADDVAAMAGAAGSTRWAEVTTAVREAATMAGICRPGDVLGLLEGDVVLIGTDVEAVAVELVDRMLDGGGELVTVVTGADAPEGAGERLVQHVERSRPAVEAMAYEGGQPHYPLLLGVE
jgi:dihydroxyacetone kinase-like predicted kinase